jgi:hypothetical protein
MKKRMTVKERREALAEEVRKAARLREMMEGVRLRAEERARTRPPGLITSECDAASMLWSQYRIPEAGTRWLLHQAPYRPVEAEGVDMPVSLDPPLSIRVATAWNEANLQSAARKFMSECKKETASLWSHRQVAGRFKLQPPADQVFAAPEFAGYAGVQPRAGRRIPMLYRRNSPDALADAQGFADDWKRGALEQKSVSAQEVTQLALLAYGLPRDAVRAILHRESYKPDPTEWFQPFRPRAAPVGAKWRPEDVHRAVLQFISECKPGARRFWSHPRVRETFKLRPPVLTQPAVEEA